MRRSRAEERRPSGRSRALLEVLHLAERVAPTETTVLICGESGTGKEVLARYLHALSGRGAGPFLSINCGAIPESLLESELFGHLKGSFTGAVRDKQGLFLAARRGTFFLDEVAEMSPATQVKLLRVLQEREVIPVGATRPVPIDVRIVAATNQDPEEAVRRGTLRQDLYYRLNTMILRLPPLRERVEDIPLLAAHFLRNLAELRGKTPPGITAEALAALQSYHWPGNIRELESALVHAVILAGEGEITPATLPAQLTRREPPRLVSETTPAIPPLATVECAYIHWVLHLQGGNKRRTAAVLQIDPSTLHRKLIQYGIGK